MDWPFCMSNFKVIFFSMLISASTFAEDIKFETAQIRLNKIAITVEVAQTPTQRQQGLMNRSKMSENHGMIFIFDSPQPLSFWMKNTKMNLSIGFFDDKRRLINVEEMSHPKTLMIRDDQLPRHTSLRPARYALEMNQGWFTRNKVEVGATFDWITSPPSD